MNRSLILFFFTGLGLSLNMNSTSIALAESPWQVFPSTGLGPVTDSHQLPHDPWLTHAIVQAIQRHEEWTVLRSGRPWNQRRVELDRQLRHLLGLDPPPDRTPLHMRVLSETEHTGCRIQNILFESRPGFYVTGNLYRPPSPASSSASTVLTTKRPAILSPIGHWLSAGKRATEVQQRCLHLAHQGFVVLAYDAIGQGERMVPGNIHHEAGYALLPLGETIAGWMVWDSMRGIDLLASLPDVDPNRIGITGNSGGGLNSLLTAALDERIQAAVVVGFTFEFGNWLQFGGTHCTCTHYPGILTTMRWSDIAGLIAPRPLMLIQGDMDGIFPISGARRSADETAQIYAQQSVPSLVRFVELPKQKHNYSTPFRESMYGWMALHLQHQGDGSPITEQEIPSLAETDPQLLCDPSRHILDAGTTVIQWAQTRAAEWAQKSTKRMPTDREIEDLRRWAEAESAPPPYHPHLLAVRVVSQEKQEPAGTLEKLSILSEEGIPLPALLWIPPTRLPPAGNSVDRSTPDVILIVAEGGKQQVAESGLAPSLVRSGFAVCAVDLRGRGETLGFYGPNWTTQFRYVATQTLSGKSPAGRRAYDIRRVIDMLAERTDVSTEHLALVGIGSDVPAALLASLTDKRIEQLVLTDFVASFRDLMLAARSYPHDQMGIHWNDPQVTGKLDVTSATEVDLSTVIYDVLPDRDVLQLLRATRANRILWCQSRRSLSSAASGIDDAWQQLEHATTASSAQSTRFTLRPDDRLTPEIIVSWLAR